MKQLDDTLVTIQDQKIDGNDNAQEDSERSEFQKQQHTCVTYWWIMIATLMVAGQNIVFFTVFVQIVNITVNCFVVVFSVPIFIYKVHKLTRNWGDFFCLIFLIDNIFVTLCGALVGYVSIMIQTMGVVNPVAITFMFFGFLQYLFFAGVYRVCLARCYWKKHEVIVAKIVLLLSLCIYLLVAVYFMSAKNGDPFAEKIAEFFFLYIFGLFALILEIFAKITDLDGTGQIRYDYVIQDEPKDKQVSERSLKKVEQKKKKKNHKIHPAQATHKRKKNKINKEQESIENAESLNA